MSIDQRSMPQPPQRPSRRSIRLTFRVSRGQIELVSHERLEMITPPQVGGRPEAGTHGGHWVELRAADDRPLSHRLISAAELNSVEVHSPDRTIERHFGEPRDSVFEVLLPDDQEAASVVLMGDELAPRKGRQRRSAPSGELARFELPGDDRKPQ